jgi:NADH dehydrogenase (ubiquinone) 1 alpha subcomplex subunit 9
MFDLGRLGLLPFNLQDEDSIRASMADSDIVVNLIGKHYETKGAVPQKRADGSFSRINSSFEDVHVEGAATIARIAGEMGVESLVHVSALAANLDSKSRWNVTKAQGEEAVRAAFPDAIIVKPATVFGAEDRFLNWIAQTLTTYPAFPLLHGGEQLVQPVRPSVSLVFVFFFVFVFVPFSILAASTIFFEALFWSIFSSSNNSVIP